MSCEPLENDEAEEPDDKLQTGVSGELICISPEQHFSGILCGSKMTSSGPISSDKKDSSRIVSPLQSTSTCSPNPLCQILPLSSQNRPYSRQDQSPRCATDQKQADSNICTPNSDVNPDSLFSSSPVDSPRVRFDPNVRVRYIPGRVPRSVRMIQALLGQDPEGEEQRTYEELLYTWTTVVPRGWVVTRNLSVKRRGFLILFFLICFTSFLILCSLPSWSACDYFLHVYLLGVIACFLSFSGWVLKCGFEKRTLCSNASSSVDSTATASHFRARDSLDTPILVNSKTLQFFSLSRVSPCDSNKPLPPLTANNRQKPIRPILKTVTPTLLSLPRNGRFSFSPSSLATDPNDTFTPPQSSPKFANYQGEHSLTDLVRWKMTHENCSPTCESKIQNDCEILPLSSSSESGSSDDLPSLGLDDFFLELGGPDQTPYPTRCSTLVLRQTTKSTVRSIHKQRSHFCISPIDPDDEDDGGNSSDLEIQNLGGPQNGASMLSPLVVEDHQSNEKKKESSATDQCGVGRWKALVNKLMAKRHSLLRLMVCAVHAWFILGVVFLLRSKDCSKGSPQLFYLCTGTSIVFFVLCVAELAFFCRIGDV